jgi:hypothetical protein
MRSSWSVTRIDHVVAEIGGRMGRHWRIERLRPRALTIRQERFWIGCTKLVDISPSEEYAYVIGC